MPIADGSPVRPDGACRRSRRPPPVLTVSTPPTRADIPGLCRQLGCLLLADDGADVICDVGGITVADATGVDALARLQLVASRHGRRLWLRHANADLLGLLSLAGLRDTLPSVGSAYADEVTFHATPSGTHGARAMPRLGGLSRVLQGVMVRMHRRAGDRFLGMDVLYLTTVGAKTGARRQTPLSYFPDAGGWLVVASAGGTKAHPSWYYNIAAHPDQIWAEIAGDQVQVTAEQLEGQQRHEAWRRITAEQSRYTDYQEKTDREIPVLRLTHASPPPPAG